MSQKSEILKWMQKGKTITTYQAYAKFNCTRLPDKIILIEKDDYVVDREWINIRKGVRVKKYWMES